ncbi:prophage maintenance system killer domain protein [Shigella flexneri 1235-66]|nr:prophage maintenance system killer domain protein [Shigella flexneri 1235-66]
MLLAMYTSKQQHYSMELFPTTVFITETKEPHYYQPFIS